MPYRHCNCECKLQAVTGIISVHFVLAVRSSNKVSLVTAAGDIKSGLQFQSALTTLVPEESGSV
jgi:hypothetical protein